MYWISFLLMTISLLLIHSFHLFLFSLFFTLNCSRHSKINSRKQKGEKITIWERNFQLAFYSILLLCIVLVYEIQVADVGPGSAVPQMFFKGWTSNTVMISLIQAVSTYVRRTIKCFVEQCAVVCCMLWNDVVIYP